jgi:hypothetical protein
MRALVRELVGSCLWLYNLGQVVGDSAGYNAPGLALGKWRSDAAG